MSTKVTHFDVVMLHYVTKAFLVHIAFISIYSYNKQLV